MKIGVQCTRCASLTIEHLVDLAYKKFSRDEGVPKAACYVLHDSIEDLETAAKAGCEFCDLLLTCFKAYQRGPNDYGWIARNWQPEKCEQEWSLYTLSKQLSCSNVRICLTSCDLDQDASFDDVKVLDALQVALGPYSLGDQPEVDIYDEPEEDPDEFPFLRLTLTTSRANHAEKPAICGRFRIGRLAVDQSLDAESNIEIAKEWLLECQTSHPKCLGHNTSELPTRVIDVGKREDWTDVRIVHGRGKASAYTALSHCWGGPITPVLTTRTIDRFQLRLPFHELPANFQDAISITRRLGVGYIWIDSLCIIQDSRADWEEESKRMGQIYRDSTLTISAMASPGSKHGIIPRNVRTEASPPRPVCIRISSTSETTVTVSREDFDEETLDSLNSSGPLSSRGWCLQESILSPRQVYYGASQLYWRCPAGYQAADGTSNGLRIPAYPVPYLSTVLYRSISRVRRDELPARQLLLRDYYGLIELYSHRNLTFGSDKLPAFSGISGRIQSTVGGTYLAGLWSSDLAYGLLWKKEMRTCKHVVQYRAPSWSWAVTEERILYDEWDDLPETFMSIELIDARISLKDKSNPYGEVTSAAITVKSLFLPLIRSKQYTEGFARDYPYGNADFDDYPPQYEDDDPRITTNPIRSSQNLFIAEEEDGNAYILATTTSLVREGTFEPEVDYNMFAPEEYLALMVHVDERQGDESETVRSIQGLIIKPNVSVEKHEVDTYLRVGTFSFSSFKLSHLKAWKKSESITLI
ncbi:hypothetical protein N0V90_006392 [Kalmusia sp. IMI 367209]|nr:hypothetical protein N0V90_006392 [Kalmusia sp. IMI 367209]